MLSNMLSAEATVELVAGWIRNKQPAALVRFLEGEARILSASLDNPENMKAAQKKLRKQSGLILSPSDVMQVREKVLLALDEADVVGMIGGDIRYNDEHEELLSRTHALFAERAPIRKSAAGFVAEGGVSEVISHKLASLLKGQITSVISSRDVGPPLTELGAEDVRVFQIPSQAIKRAVDEGYEAVLHSTPIWPDFLRELENRLTVRERGEVFLVGAGLFGKHLCIQVRDLGGIAIDLGSQLDRMANKPTRGRRWNKFLASRAALAQTETPSD